MARISTYSTEKPVAGDLVIGTDVTASDVTKNFKVEEIAALAGTGALVNLEQVLTAGNTAINNMQLTGTIVQPTGDHNLSAGNLTLTAGYISLGGALKDASSSDGTAGQVLTSTGTVTSWVDQSTIVGAPHTLEEVLTAGNNATNLDINLAGTGKIVTVGTGVSSFVGGISVGANASTFLGTVAFSDNVTANGELKVSDVLRDASASVGLAGQVLSSTGTGVSWIPSSSLGATITQVLTAGNTANNLDLNLTGTGVFTSAATTNSFGGIVVGAGVSSFAGTVGFNANIATAAELQVNAGMRDSTSALGVAGQVLSSTGTATEWINSSSIGTLTQVLTAGNTANNLNINLTGTGAITTAGVSNFQGGISVGANPSTFTGTVGFNANIDTSSTLTVLGALRDGASLTGTAGQVLTSTGTQTSWVDQSTIVGTVPTLQQVLGAGANANDVGISFTGTGSTTFAAAQTINSLAPNIWGATNSFTSNGTTIGTAGINLSGSLSDGTDTGTAGQTLQSTNTGVAWVDGQQQVTTALSSAQILALTSTPIAVVAGVAGKHIVPQQVIVKYTFGTVAYTTTNVGLLYLGTASSNSIAAVFSSSILTGGSNNTFLNSPNPSGSLGADYTPQYNTSTGGDDLLFGWATLNPIGGDGTLSVTVVYTLIDA
jgi:hypothetical protein